MNIKLKNFTVFLLISVIFLFSGCAENNGFYLFAIFHSGFLAQSSPIYSQSYTLHHFILFFYHGKITPRVQPEQNDTKRKKIN